jgi:hypothetical protein
MADLPGRPWENRGAVRYFRERLHGQAPHPARGGRPVSPNEDSRDDWEYLAQGPAMFKYAKVVRDIKRNNTRARRREEQRQARQEIGEWL